MNQTSQKSFPVTWDQFHRDSRALAWRLTGEGPFAACVAITRGGLVPAEPAPSPREVHLLQRKTSRIGKGLGKTTGWVHRAALKAKGVHQHPGVNYERIDDAGLHVSFGQERANPTVIEVDTIVLCTGQESVNTLGVELAARGRSVHVIGGADVAAELDAKRAIRQGTELAASL